MKRPASLYKTYLLSALAAASGIIFALSAVLGPLLKVTGQWQAMAAAQTKNNIYTNLFIILAFSAVPLLLAAAAGFMGWKYRRELDQTKLLEPGPVPDAEPDATGRLRDGSQLRLIQASASEDPGPAANQILKDVRDVTTRVRFTYLVAALTYAALSTVFLLQAAAKLPLESRILMPYLILAPQIVVVTWFIRMSLRLRLWIFLGYAFIGSLPVFLVAEPKRTLGLVVALIGPFVIYPLAGLYFLLARRMQPFLILLAATLLYIGAGVVTFHLIMSHPAEAAVAAVSEKPWLIWVGLANLVLGVILARELLRQSWPGRVYGLVTLAVVAILGGRMPLHGASLVLSILSGTAGSVLGVLFVWVVFKAFVWLQERRRWLTPEILDAHFCWAYLTLYLQVWAWGLKGKALSDSGLLPLGLVFAFVLFIIVLHALLLRIRARRPRQASQRLLLLRVFGKADEREDLLDALDDTWRRIGAVDLLVSSDVASRTLRSSMLEAFLLRRSADQFLKTDAGVDLRLHRLPAEIEADGRYPVNGVYCYGNVWQRAFIRLSQDAAAVLMDVRGFTSQNRNCAWELAYLVKHTPLRRILLLVDERTDREALKREAQAAWTHLPPESPNASDPEPELRFMGYDRQAETDGRKLFRLLLRAAGDSATT